MDTLSAIYKPPARPSWSRPSAFEVPRKYKNLQAFCGWAILGSNPAGGLGPGAVPHDCWARVILSSLRFAQNGTTDMGSDAIC